MAITVTPLLNLIHACDAEDWSGGDLDTGVFKQGTGSLGESVSNTTSAVFTYTLSSTNFTGQHLYQWMLNTTRLDTKANGGLRMFMRSTNLATKTWYVAGSDTYPGGWQCYVVDPSSSADVESGSFDITQVDQVGVQFKTLQAIKAGLVTSYWDVVRYGTGLRITSGSADTITFEDIFLDDDNVSNAYGIVSKVNGVYFSQGELIFGSTTAGQHISFTDTSQIVVFKDQPVNASLYGIAVEGNDTGTSNFTLGAAAGSAGISGCVIKSAGTKKYSLDLTGANTDKIQLYGSTFNNAGTISLPAAGADNEVLNCNFDTCDQLNPSSCFVRNCNFISTTDVDSSLLWNSSADVEDCNFIANTIGAGIEHDVADTYTYSGLIFSGNTYDVLNSIAGVVNINVSGVGAASTAENTGGGSTNFISSLDIDIAVQDTSGASVADAQIYIQKSDAGKQWNYVSHSGNALNDTDFVVTGAIDSDLPSGGWIHVWDKSDNTKQNYRYSAWSTSTDTTFTLKGNVTGSATSTDGTSPETKLISTSSNFSTMKTAGTIEEGDTIYNSTDLCWAVVDEIVDADNVTTSPLQGGTNNEWQDGDGFSLHKLVKNYTITDDKVDIPLFNGQTDSNGEISTSYNYGEIGNPPGQGGYTSLPIRIRVRSNYGTPKYIPYNTSGSITGNGYTLTAVITEDDVAA